MASLISSRRGFLLGALRAKGIATGLAVALQAAIFTVPHGMMQSVWILPGLFIVGAGLGYMRVWSGGLALPIAAHMVFNATSLVIAPFADDIEAWQSKQQAEQLQVE